MVGQDLISRHPPGQLAHKMYSTVMRVPSITGLPNMRDSLCWFLLAKFDLAAGKVTCPLSKNGLEHLIFFRREINPHPNESFQVVLPRGWCVPPEGFQKGDRMTGSGGSIVGRENRVRYSRPSAMFPASFQSRR
jgi:hypothetical protein